MSKYGEENILVISRALFDGMGAFQGFCPDVARYLPGILDPANNFFLRRDEAEEDPAYKQIIPYAVFHHGSRILHYYRGRGGGEKRLAAKGSIGIGGHINDSDHAASSLDRDTYTVGVEREIEEELVISCGHRQRIIGLINDDSNEVGKVHLGVVHLVTLDDERVEPGEENITDLSFRPLDELREERERLESWSSMCLEHLDHFLGRPGNLTR